MGEAKDGATALEEIGRLRPDIVMTDVRMPAMDGMRMSTVLREQAPNLKIVFISGHDDADYLKSALKVSAVDYIFKPVNVPELQTVIERINAELDEERRRQKQIRDLSAQLKESMPLLRDKFLVSLHAGRQSIHRCEV